MAMAWPSRRFMCSTRNWLKARLVSRSVANRGRGRHSRCVGRRATTSYLRGSGFMAEPSPNQSPSDTPMKADARPLDAGLCSMTSPESTACQPSTAEPAGSMTAPLAPSVEYTPWRSFSCRKRWRRDRRWVSGAKHGEDCRCRPARECGKTRDKCRTGDRCWIFSGDKAHCAAFASAVMQERVATKWKLKC